MKGSNFDLSSEGFLSSQMWASCTTQTARYLSIKRKTKERVLRFDLRARICPLDDTLYLLPFLFLFLSFLPV